MTKLRIIKEDGERIRATTTYCGRVGYKERHCAYEYATAQGSIFEVAPSPRQATCERCKRFFERKS